jgi:hypothetical protein
MLRTCPICNRNFEAFAVNATYCNVSCRKKAGREQEKKKRSAFYEPPAANDPRVLHQMIRPTLNELVEMADILTRFVRLTQASKAVYIFGTIPDGWQDTDEVMLAEQIGMTPQTWALISLLETTTPMTSPNVLVPPETPRSRQQLAAALANEDRAIEKQLMNDL